MEDEEDNDISGILKDENDDDKDNDNPVWGSKDGIARDCKETKFIIHCNNRFSLNELFGFMHHPDRIYFGDDVYLSEINPMSWRVKRKIQRSYSMYKRSFQSWQGRRTTMNSVRLAVSISIIFIILPCYI